MRPQFKKFIKWLLISVVALIIALVIYIFFFSTLETPISADSRRLSNVKRIAISLELYKGEYDVYPNSLDQLVPKWIGALPIQPTEPNKNCTIEQNQYKYTLLPDDKFKIDFCLGKPLGEFKTGMNTLYSQD